MTVAVRILKNAVAITKNQMKRMAFKKELPAVGGRRLDCSNNEFERRCLVCLMREQEKPNPDNLVIAVLCDAVRCVREYNDYAEAYFKRIHKPVERQNQKPK